jgi:hypothetical protein
LELGRDRDRNGTNSKEEAELTWNIVQAFLNDEAHDAIGEEDEILAGGVGGADHSHHGLHLIGKLENMDLWVLQVRRHHTC